MLKPKQLAQSSAITKIVFSQRTCIGRSKDIIPENVGIDIGDSGEQQQSQNAMPGEDEEHLCSYSFNVAIRQESTRV